MDIILHTCKIRHKNCTLQTCTTMYSQMYAPLLDFPAVLLFAAGPVDVSDVVEQLSACTLHRERERQLLHIIL